MAPYRRPFVAALRPRQSRRGRWAGTKIPPTAYDSVIDADSPISHWKLGDGGAVAVDRKGLFNLPVVGGVTMGVTGLLTGNATNTAADLNGSTGYISAGFGSEFGTPYEYPNVSVELWIKPTLGNDAYIIERPGVGVWRIAISPSGSINWMVNVVGIGQTLVYSSIAEDILVDGQTYYLCGTYNGVDAILYVNGRETARQRLVGALETAANYAPSIGSFSDGSSNFYDGVIDEVAFYGTALSRTRIQAHYTAGSGTVFGNAPPPQRRRTPIHAGSKSFRYPFTRAQQLEQQRRGRRIPPYTPPPPKSLPTPPPRRVAHVAAGRPFREPLPFAHHVRQTRNGLWVATAPQPVSLNLIRNGGFELTASPWASSGTGGFSASKAITRSSTWAQSGSWSLRLTGTNAGAAGESVSGQLTGIPVSEGNRYTLGMYVNAVTPAAGSALLMVFRNAANSQVGVTNISSNPGSTVVGTYRVTFTVLAPATAVTATIGVNMTSNVNAEAVELYFDDVVFVQGIVAPDYVPLTYTTLFPRRRTRAASKVHRPRSVELRRAVQRPRRWVGTVVVGGGDITPPVTLYVTETQTKVSLVTGFDVTTVTWSADEACQAWEIRQVATTGDTHNDGTLLTSGGAISAGVSQNTPVSASTLVGGDGAKILKIFAQDLAGNWTV